MRTGNFFGGLNSYENTSLGSHADRAVCGERGLVKAGEKTTARKVRSPWLPPSFLSAVVRLKRSWATSMKFPLSKGKL